MITIHHVLKDGTEAADITGKVIDAQEFEVLYQMISRIEEGRTNETVSTPD